MFEELFPHCLIHLAYWEQSDTEGNEGLRVLQEWADCTFVHILVLIQLSIRLNNYLVFCEGSVWYTMITCNRPKFPT